MSDSKLSVEQQISSLWDLGGLTWQELPRRVWGGLTRTIWLTEPTSWPTISCWPFSLYFCFWSHFLEYSPLKEVNYRAIFSSTSSRDCLLSLTSWLSARLKR